MINKKFLWLFVHSKKLEKDENIYQENFNNAFPGIQRMKTDF